MNNFAMTSQSISIDTARSSKFTHALMHRLYADTTLHTSTLKESRKSARFDALRIKEIRNLQTQHSVRRKRNIIQYLHNNQTNNLRISPEKIMRLDEISLIRLVKKAEIDLKHRQAAQRLQRWWRVNRPSHKGRFGLKYMVQVMKAVGYISDWYKRLKMMREERALRLLKVFKAVKMQTAFRLRLEK